MHENIRDCVHLNYFHQVLLWLWLEEMFSDIGESGSWFELKKHNVSVVLYGANQNSGIKISMTLTNWNVDITYISLTTPTLHSSPCQPVEIFTDFIIVMSMLCIPEVLVKYGEQLRHISLYHFILTVMLKF